MRALTPENHTFLVENFLNQYPQLRELPEFPTTDELFEFIDAIVKEEGQNWLQGKPTRLNPEPPRGRAI